MSKHFIPAAAGLLLSAGCVLAAQAAELTIYQRANFSGNELVLRGNSANIPASGYNEQVASVVVESGHWQVCSGANFKGYCTTLSRGEYARLDVGLNNHIASARPVPAPQPAAPVIAIAPLNPVNPDAPVPGAAEPAGPVRPSMAMRAQMETAASGGGPILPREGIVVSDEPREPIISR